MPSKLFQMPFHLQAPRLLRSLFAAACIAVSALAAPAGAATLPDFKGTHVSEGVREVAGRDQPRDEREQGEQPRPATVRSERLGGRSER